MFSFSSGCIFMVNEEFVFDKIKSIVFVCTGNTCRSPMAEGLMKKLLSEKNINNVDVFSRGISVFEGSRASENSVSAIKKYDVDLSFHKAKLLTFEEINSAGLILTMSEGHRNAILSTFPEYEEKVFTIYKFAFDEEKDISDPFGGSIEVYEKCLDEIYKCLKEIVNKYS